MLDVSKRVTFSDFTESLSYYLSYLLVTKPKGIPSLLDIEYWLRRDSGPLRT